MLTTVNCIQQFVDAPLCEYGFVVVVIVVVVVVEVFEQEGSLIVQGRDYTPQWLPYRYP